MNGRVVYGMPDAEYRTDPAVSYSGLKVLLNESPAQYQWTLKHRVHRDVYDFGHAVHGVVLGVGDPVCVIDAASWQTVKAREQRDAAYERGEVPLLTETWEQVQACATAITEHPLAGPILGRPGESEVSVFWTDEDTGVACKSRIDRVTVTPDGVHYLLDAKTVGMSANPDAFGRVAAKFDYHMQGAKYKAGYCSATGLPPDQVEWLNILVEKTAPYSVAVTRFCAPTLAAGHAKWRAALGLYARCVASGEWPGYTPSEAQTVSIPGWAMREDWE